MNEEEENLEGNEFDWIHSQTGIDSSELLLYHCDPTCKDNYLV
jgi:hypothetical protein